MRLLFTVFCWTFVVFGYAQTINLDFCPSVPAGGVASGDTLYVPIIIEGEAANSFCELELRYDFPQSDLSYWPVPDSGPAFAFVDNDHLVVATTSNPGWTSGDTLITLGFIANANTTPYLFLRPSVAPDQLNVIINCDLEFVPYSHCGDVRFDGVIANQVDLCPQVPNELFMEGDTAEIPVLVSGFDNLIGLRVTSSYNAQDFSPVYVYIAEENSVTVLPVGFPGFLDIIIPELYIRPIQLAAGDRLFTLKLVATADNVSLPGGVNISNDAIATNYLGADVPLTQCEEDYAAVLTRNLDARIYPDTLTTCELDTVDNSPLKRWYLRLTNQNSGAISVIQTNDLGYATGQLAPGTYSYEWLAPVQSFAWEVCPEADEITVSDTSLTLLRSTVNKVLDCAANQISVSSTNLRPCFSNNTIQLSYGNFGSSTSLATHIELWIDEAFVPLSTTLEYTELGSGHYRFDLGDLPIGTSGNIYLTGQLDCAFPVGNTLCAEAAIYPNKDCYVINPDFMGGEVTLSSSCDQDSVRFTALNVGDGATGPIGFKTIKDGVQLDVGTVALATGEALNIAYAADGSTFRMEFERPFAAPYLTHPLAIIEGCNADNGQQSNGWVNTFSLLDFDSYYDRYCLQTSAAYDPNDKTAIPFGYGPDHFIYPNTMIDYRIRFQNTGTDTAFNVVVRDTIDTELLNMSTFRPGISSHPYDLTIENGNELVFTFNDIRLVDSFTNEPGSNGYLHYEIAQQPDLPDWTEIDTRAGIYFDFNEVVLTEYSELTVARTFLPSGVRDQRRIVNRLTVGPNPTNGTLRFFASRWYGPAQITVQDASGKILAQRKINESNQRLNFLNLPAGQYWYRIDFTDGARQIGKFVKVH